MGKPRIVLLIVAFSVLAIVVFGCTGPAPSPVSTPTTTPTPTSSLTPTLTPSVTPGTTILPSTPAAATLKSPLNGARTSSLTPTLEWQSSTGDVTYGLQIAADPGFNNLIIEEKRLKEASYIVPLSKLNYGKTYYWRVGVGIAGGKSGWSQAWSFSAQITPTTTTTIFAPPEKAADLVLVNGKVITVDAKDSIVQAVAVKNGKIIKVGSNDEVKALIGQQTSILDLKGRTVTPGLVDSHIHVEYWGSQFWPGFLDIRYPKANTKADLLRLVAERAKVTPKGEWIAGNQGFSIAMEETPDRWELDSVSPDNPVYLRHMGGQHVIVNSYALRLAGITRYTPNPYGGKIEKDPASGEPTGRLFHYSAESLVGRLVPGYGGVRASEEKAEDVKRGQDSALAAGYTSGQDVIVFSPEAVDAYKQVAANNELKMRIYILHYVSSEQDGINLLSRIKPFKSEILTFGGWKFAVDGGCAAGTILMYDRTLPAAKNSYEYWDQQALNRMVSTYHKAGFQVSFHALGDKGIDMALNAIEAALKETPRENSRFKIEHLLFPTMQALERIKKLGVVVSMQPQWVRIWGEGFRNSTNEETMQRFIPLRTMMEMGIHIAFGCDVPSTPYLEPKYAFMGAVTRTTASGYTPAPQECISIKDALRMHTMGSAYASFEENIKGSIEEGKLADMVVWSHDLYTMPSSQYKDLKAVVTIVGGKIVYEEK